MVPTKTVLIACSRLVDLAGAEITTLELAEAFTGLGAAVSVASFEVSDDMRAHLSSLGTRVLDLSSEHAFAETKQFDLAWIHHSVVATRILAEPGLLLGKVVHSSLSHFSPLECPPPLQFRLSHYLVHSDENLEHFVAKYPELSSSVSVMNNSVLARNWNGAPSVRAADLRRLAVVSNHLPGEVTSLVELLANDRIAVDVFGSTGKQIRVSPELLREYDAVITIGKTVQYAIAAGIPVYCYDHFGGDGWITPENFQSARAYNFSGRGGRASITAEHLRKDLFEGYKAALAGTGRLYELGVQYFVLENNIRSILADLPAYERPCLSATDSNIMIRQSGVFMDLRRQITYRDNLASDLRGLLQSEQDNARKQILYRDDLLAELRGQLEAEKNNARSQILYRDELVAQLKAQLEAEKNNARAQILYRDTLVVQAREQLEAEKNNARSQILYRDALVAQSHEQLEEEKNNSRAQIAYRDALVAQSQDRLEAEKENARSQILYRDALVSQLQEQLEAEKNNARSQILYRDALVAQLQGQLENASRKLSSRLYLLLAKKLSR